MVSIKVPAATEEAVVSLILQHKRQQTASGSASLRLTARKLTVGEKDSTDDDVVLCHLPLNK